MPALSPEDRRQLLGPLPDPCPHCCAPRIRHYCRSCDLFLVCCICLHARAFGDHDGHRLYIWTPDGVLAHPSFD